MAVEMVERIGEEKLSGLRMGRHDEIALLMRMKRFDDQVRGFMARNPNGAVVHIGCGLDTRFQRVDNGSVEWFDIDLPAVTGVRERLIQVQTGRYHCLGKSILEDEWISEVIRCKPRSFMFVAEGVLEYFEQAQVKALVLKLKEHFPGCELVCDVSTPFVIFLDNLHIWVRNIKAQIKWGEKNPKELESWGEGIRLLEGWNYYDNERAEFSKSVLLKVLGPLWKYSGIYRYRLGEGE